jgi:uncharacterized OB-fold protein
MSGTGKVWSWCIFHQRYFPSFEADLPYHVAVVQLQEGPLMTTNLVGVQNHEIGFDMPVEIEFDDVTPEFTLIKFKPAGSSRFQK